MNGRGPSPNVYLTYVISTCPEKIFFEISGELKLSELLDQEQIYVMRLDSDTIKTDWQGLFLSHTHMRIVTVL